MKISACLLLVFAAWVSQAWAQQVWTYEVVQPDGRTRVFLQAPSDLSDPPPHQAASVNDLTAKQQGTVLTPEQEKKRLRAPMLIISLQPLTTARHIFSGGPD